MTVAFNGIKYHNKMFLIKKQIKIKGNNGLGCWKGGNIYKSIIFYIKLRNTNKLVVLKDTFYHP